MTNMVIKRNAYKKENNGTCEQLIKLIMNGMFGKLIQKPIFEKTHIVEDIKKFRDSHNIYIKDDFFEIG